MTYEFEMIEAGFEALDEDVLKSLATDGDVPVLREQLQSGHYVLLCKAPTLPLLCRKKNDLDKPIWVINDKARYVVDKAVRAALQDCIHAAEEKEQASKAHVAATPRNDALAQYEPEPVPPSRHANPPKAEFEYHFDVACSDTSFVTNVCCSFALSRTAHEPTISHWEKTTTPTGTRYTATAFDDEPRKLLATLGSMQLGISCSSVQLHHVGSHQIKEAFIPVVPAVQFGPRLGLPTVGYYYHFLNTTLIQEYKIVGRGNWSFFATRSTAHHLDSEEGANKYQSAILLHWQRDGKDVTGQSLLYTAAPLSYEQLSSVTAEWLAYNAVSIEPSKLLSTKHTTTDASATYSNAAELPAIPPATLNHPDYVHYSLTERYLIAGQVKAINTPSLLESDTVVVNLRNLSGTSLALPN
ncbi:MAG: hypothetical protein ACTMIA_06715 [Vibrio sp.]